MKYGIDGDEGSLNSTGSCQSLERMTAASIVSRTPYDDCCASAPSEFSVKSEYVMATGFQNHLEN
jgi:hypothetical protein